MLLDLRTLNYLGHADIYRKAIKLWLKEYVRFSFQFYKYERAVKKEELADAEESKDDDHMDTLIINNNTATLYLLPYRATHIVWQTVHIIRGSRSVKRRFKQMMQTMQREVLRWRSNGGVVMCSIETQYTQTRS